LIPKKREDRDGNGLPVVGVYDDPPELHARRARSAQLNDQLVASPLLDGLQTGGEVGSLGPHARDLQWALLAVHDRESGLPSVDLPPEGTEEDRRARQQLDRTLDPASYVKLE